MLHKHGGYYIRENTIFTKELGNIELQQPRGIIYAMSADFSSGFIATEPGLKETNSLSGFLHRNKEKITQLSCVLHSDYSDSEYSQCLIFDDRVWHPKDFWKRNNDVAHLVNVLMYGSPQIPQPVQYEESVVPNIAHIVWMGGGEMKYIFYLCVLSLMHIVKVDEVHIHGNKVMTGPYWSRLMENERVHFIHRADISFIFSADVTSLHHKADVIRADIMLKHGGLHVDPDVLFVKPLPPDMFKYDAVATVDSYLYPMRPFPDVLSLGTVLSKPYGRFWQLYQQSQIYYVDQDWTWNSGRIPYKIYERNPGLLQIEPYLQVICFDLRCYPTWVNTRQEAFSLADVPDRWWHMVYAFHIVDIVPPELQDEGRVRSGRSVFADIGKAILDAAAAGEGV